MTSSPAPFPPAAAGQRGPPPAAAEIEQQPLSPAQQAELDRRVKAADDNPNKGIPWEVVKAAALARSRR